MHCLVTSDKFITFAKEVMLTQGICLFVCSFVNRIAQKRCRQILAKFFWRVPRLRCVASRKWFGFDADPTPVTLELGLGLRLPWLRFAWSEYSFVFIALGFCVFSNGSMHSSECPSKFK